MDCTNSQGCLSDFLMPQLLSRRAMNKILSIDLEKFVIPYFDDSIIFSTTLEEHTLRLKIVLDKTQGSRA